MKFFDVVSEPLERVEWEDWSVGAGHLEEYRIHGTVMAESRGQAKYKVWKTDKNSFSTDIRDMPRFETRQITKEMFEDLTTRDDNTVPTASR